ncbi:MAG: O-antigen ligase family protein [Pyrinomonadaceae bacterium]
MTTSIYNAQAETLTPEQAALAQETPAAHSRAALAEVRRTWAGRSVFVLLSVAIVLTTLAYGTVHSWTLAVFQGSAALVVVLWMADAWLGGTLRVSRNALQLPLLGLLIVGLIQLLPLGAGAASSGGGALSLTPTRSLSLDPYTTRLVLIKIASLLVYFAAALAFTDSPRRLRTLVRTVTIFGFLLALFGLIQHFTSPTTIYWIRDLPASKPFGPFINSHHFAGYMELTLALPLGLLFSGAVERDKRLLYGFAVAVMGIALIMTNSRGGIISFFAEVCFLAAVSGFGRKQQQAGEDEEKGGRARAAVVRVGLALALLISLFVGVVLLGGESVLSRFVGTVNTQDPTTGRAHFWSMTLDIIRDHPLLGAGLGAFGLAYTRYDTRNGLFRLEQAHNDYLQVVSDAGIVGAILGLFFIVALFRMGFQRMQTKDTFRRGVALGALAGCFAVLVHSFFDFTLHTTSNALLFLVLAALATVNGRVEQSDAGDKDKSRGRRRRRRRHRSHSGTPVSSSSSSNDGETPAVGQETGTVVARDAG